MKYFVLDTMCMCMSLIDDIVRIHKEEAGANGEIYNYLCTGPPDQRKVV